MKSDDIDNLIKVHGDFFSKYNGAVKRGRRDGKEGSTGLKGPDIRICV